MATYMETREIQEQKTWQCVCGMMCAKKGDVFVIRVYHEFSNIQSSSLATDDKVYMSV